MSGTHQDSSSDNEDTPHDERHGKKHGFRKCFKKGHGSHSNPEGFVSEQNNESRKCHSKRRDIASDTEGNAARGSHGKENVCKKRFQMRCGRHSETEGFVSEPDNEAKKCPEGNIADGRHEKRNKYRKQFQMGHGGHSEMEGFTSEQDNRVKKCHRKRRDIASDTEGNTVDGTHEKRNKCKKHFQMRHGGHSEMEGFASEQDNQTRKCHRKRCDTDDEKHENRNKFKKHFRMRHGGHSESEESEQDDNVRNCCHKGRQTDETENAESCDENAFSGRPDIRQLFWSLMNNPNMHHKGGRFGKKHHFGHHMKHGGGHFGKMGKHFKHHMKHGHHHGSKLHNRGKFHHGKNHHHNSMLRHHHGRHGFQYKHGRFDHKQNGHYQRKKESFDGVGTSPDTMVIVLE